VKSLLHAGSRHACLPVFVCVDVFLVGSHVLSHAGSNVLSHDKYVV
jgi:hypothetical protein